MGVFEDGSEEWHGARLAGLGGSEIASVIGGVGAFKSKTVLWYEKAGIKGPDEISPEKQELFDLGHELEPFIASKFQAKHPDFIVETSGSWRNINRGWQLLNPDRLLRDAFTGEVITLLELKYSMHGFGYENGGLPPKYVAQVRWYCSGFGFSGAYLAVFIGGKGEYIEFWIPATPNLPVVNLKTGEQDWYSPDPLQMIQAGQAFMDSLAAGVPPELDGDEGTLEYLANRNPEIDKDLTVDLDFELARRWALARQAEKDTEAEVKLVKAMLVERLGKAKAGKWDGKTVVMRKAIKGGVISIQGFGKIVIPELEASDEAHIASA